MMNEMREPTAAGGGLNKGHTGDPIENAIDIQAPDHRTGTLMECAHVEERLGASGKDWDLITRGTVARWYALLRSAQYPAQDRPDRGLLFPDRFLLPAGAFF